MSLACVVSGNSNHQITRAMPPKKRAKISQAASPTPTSQPKTPTPAEGSPSKSEEQLLNDPWTDEEEIGLFKGLMRWKPTGAFTRPVHVVRVELMSAAG